MTPTPLPTPFAQATARAAARALSSTGTFTPGQRIAAVARLPRLPRLLGTVVAEAAEQRPGASAIYWVQFDGDKQQRLRFAWELCDAAARVAGVVSAEVAA